MVEAFTAGDVGAMFAPAGTLPYLTSEHEIVAQATTGHARHRTLESRLVVRSDAPSVEIDDLVRQRIGRVNRYCTTSYWAPMIALLRTAPIDRPLDFCDATGFEGMLVDVVEGRTATAMVWNAVLEEFPTSANKTRTVLRRVGLPSPVIIANDLSAVDRRRLARGLVGLKTSEGASYFNGFDSPDVEGISRFEREMACARQHFYQHRG